MSSLHVSEYKDIRTTPSGAAQVPMEPSVTTQKKTIGVAVQSDAFSDGVNLVRLCPDTNCYIAFGDNPTATANSMFLPAYSIEYFGVKPGDKVSVYDGTT